MSTREGSFETEEQFVVSHRKFIHEDIWVAFRVLLVIALSVAIVFLPHGSSGISGTENADEHLKG